MTPTPYAWAGTVGELLARTPLDWLAEVVAHQTLQRGQPPPTPHRQAWRDSLRILSAALKRCLQDRPSAAEWHCVFEYELPYEGGRRADLVILAANVIVVEFKGYRNPVPPNVHQVAGYARDLSLYHAGCRDRVVEALLVLTRRTGSRVQSQSVTAVGPDEFADVIAEAAGAGTPIDARAWLAADYAPLPSVIEAARRVFNDEPLPDIRRVRSSRVPHVLATIDQVIGQAKAGSERHLVLVTGVPGAGKTLVGLSAVYRHGVDAKSVYLTGNGPLVEVLRYALGSKLFVRPVRNFYLRYRQAGKVPGENLFVFDEAQRAWDATRMGTEYGIATTAGEAVLGVADRAPGWAVVVALLGEGQEIHTGEEEGPGQWAVGVRAAKHKWFVHTPPQLASHFGRSKQVRVDAALHLDTGLRAHRAGAVPAWAAALLHGDLAHAAALARDLQHDGYSLLLTRDLAAAKQHVTARYDGEPTKTFGLLASSRARNLVPHGVPNDYLSTRKVLAGPWYLDPVDSLKSCRRLEACVTEFGAQGLELDTPIVCWGGDLSWDGKQWVTTTRQATVRDPLRLRRNSYRVLLTRGRDGLVVFVPADSGMNSTASALFEAGVLELPATAPG